LWKRVSAQIRSPARVSTERPGRDIVIYASYQLGRTLIEIVRDA
jgi:hypothetical protein